jgi:CRISPR-associated protein Cas5d
MREPEKVRPIQAGGGAPDGTQRNMLALQDVEYLITTEVRLTEIGKKNNGLGKYLEEIKRRARSGKCFHRPSLGVREFAADFEWEEDAQAALERRTAELQQDWRDYQEELGLMLYDVFDANERAAGFRWLREEEIEALQAQREAGRKAKSKAALANFEGRLIKPQAAFFRAAVKQSKLDCHPERVKFARRAALDQ